MPTVRVFVVTMMAVSLAACSRTPTARQLGQDAVTAMGGAALVQGVKTLTMREGVGTRHRLGQTVKVGDPEPVATLKNVTETLDRANNRAALDYELQIGPFGQHRREILTRKNDRPVGLEDVAGRPLAVTSPSGLFSWGTQNHPEFLLRAKRDCRRARRGRVGVGGCAAGQAVRRPHAQVRTREHCRSENRITVYFEPESKLIAGFEALDTESMLGDAPSQYVFADYRDVGGLKLPHKITIRKLGQPFPRSRYSSASVNDAGG